ncbi:MAG: hypothetical protein J6N52_09515 [Clostridia bacterium]|nr:hypothetical protein [Clostridia bacterium]
MDYFLQTYKKRCKQEFKELGFCACQRNQYRVINDVFQSFCLHRSCYGNNATIEFCVLPLSQEYRIDKSTCGSMHLMNFDNSCEWFSYVSDDVESVDICIEEMLSYAKAHLIPFFEKSTNCPDAYNSLKIFDRKNEIHFNEYIKLIMALKNQEYILAEKHVENLIIQCKTAYENNKMACGEDISTDYINKIEKKIKKRKKLLQLIRNKNYVYIQTWLKNNELANLQSLGVFL